MLIDSFSLAEKSLMTGRYYQVLPVSRKIVALFVNKGKREKQKNKKQADKLWPSRYLPAQSYNRKLEQVVK